MPTDKPKYVYFDNPSPLFALLGINIVKARVVAETDTDYIVEYPGAGSHLTSENFRRIKIAKNKCYKSLEEGKSGGKNN